MMGYLGGWVMVTSDGTGLVGDLTSCKKGLAHSVKGLVRVDGLVTSDIGPCTTCSWSWLGGFGCKGWQTMGRTICPQCCVGELSQPAVLLHNSWALAR